MQSPDHVTGITHTCALPWAIVQSKSTPSLFLPGASTIVLPTMTYVVKHAHTQLSSSLAHGCDVVPVQPTGGHDLKTEDIPT